MAKLIEELYYGNINPQERTAIGNDTFQEQVSILSDSESYLTQHLLEDQKKKFLVFSNAWSSVNGESALDNFIQGFRLGANFVYDTFVSGSAPFRDYRPNNKLKGGNQNARHHLRSQNRPALQTGR